MERRKRVESIMASKIFREELEKIIESQMREGGPASGTLLQQISEMMGASASWKGSMLFRGGNCAIPINDIRGVDSMSYAKGEKTARCKLAALYRIIDLFGWSENIYNHVTLRVSHDEAHFLINPFGMLYNEITASSLIKVDVKVSGCKNSFFLFRQFWIVAFVVCLLSFWKPLDRFVMVECVPFRLYIME